MMKDSPTTKKMLVAFDPAKPGKAFSDFLVPVLDNGELVFFDTKSKRNVALGMVVFVGREITVNDVFARLVDSGRKIPVVAEALDVISNYLSQVNGLRIGQVVQMFGDASRKGFSLQEVKVAKPPNKRSLP
jgi:hypothetical protein